MQIKNIKTFLTMKQKGDNTDGQHLHVLTGNTRNKS